MRLGIYGGTFNPIHYGHLKAALKAREQFSLDKIFFIPTKEPVHKESSPFISSADRCRMIELALSGNKYFFLSKTEVEREQPSYTVYTLREIKKEYPSSQIFLLLGSDSFERFHTWKNYQEILASTFLLVLRRPGGGMINKALEKFSNIKITDNSMQPISSSDIRERRQQGKSIKGLVPEVVREYIYEKDLYR